MRLSGFVFIIIGAAVAIFSYVLLKRGQKMGLFMFVGIVMLVYGVWKLYIDKSLPPEKNEQKEALRRPQPHTMQFDQPKHNFDIPRTCSTCKTRNNPRANFCGYCGTKL